MQVGKTYFHDAFELRPEVRALAEQIEAAAGMRIEFVYAPNSFHQLFGPECMTAAGAWTSECQAAVIGRLPVIPERTIYHELLHIKIAWIDHGTRLSRSSGQPLGLLEGYQNDLEHLLIVPKERTLFDSEEDRAHWVRAYGDPTTRLHPVPSFQHIRLFMGWLLARELLMADELVAWRTILDELGLFDAANAFSDDVVSTLPDLEKAWLAIFDWLDLRLPDFQWKQFDPRNRKVLLSELPPPD